MTTEATAQDLRYPIGTFDKNLESGPDGRREFIRTLAELPARITEAVDGLSDEQLDTPYRPGGWTVRQTVHHVADSHMNAYIRFKLALTEDNPTIRPYYEDRWAKLADSRLPVSVSLRLIEDIHSRWVTVLNSMTDEEFARKLVHPESGEWTLEKMLGLYAWHSRHHTGHITSLRDREAW
jgi:uncharacterized damage-inducible protein DinB